MTDLSDAIETAAAEPLKMQGDAGSVEQRPIQELIAADQYLASKRAAASRGRGLVLTKLKPPGATE